MDEESVPREDLSDESYGGVTAFQLTWRRGLAVIIGLVLTDAAAFVLVESMPPMPVWSEMLLGAIILVALVVPLLYLSLLRRFEQNIGELAEMDARLRRVRETLRERVKQKTTELEAANTQLVTIIGELEANIRDQSLLGEMSDMLQSYATPEEACSVFAEFAKRLCPGTAGALCLVADSRNFLEVAGAWGDIEFLERVFAPGDCWALRRGAPYKSDATRMATSCRHTQPREGQQYLCVPLNAQGEPIGVLCLALEDRPDDPRFEAFQQRIERMAGHLADDAAIAVANLRLREKLHHQSIRDGLTKLFNRRYMEEFLELEIQRAMRGESEVAVVMIDVDHFKKFNDTYGHNAGDAVLRAVARALQKGVRAADVACRYGGEEFTLILSNATEEEAVRRCEDLRAAIEALAVEEQGQSLPGITVSMGIALYPKHATEAEALVRAADTALYAAKEAGRNRVMIANEFVPGAQDADSADA
jgi:diguanylate cyclase (GGDEF)-like protein